MNIWRTELAGSWPRQLTQSDEAQRGLVVSPDGRTLYYLQDHGGDEMYDIWAVPTAGGPAKNITTTADVREFDMLISPGGQIAVVTTKGRAQAQVELALIDLRTLATRPLVSEPDPTFRWSPVAWVSNGKTLIAERANAAGTETGVFAVDRDTGRQTPILAKPDTIFEAGGASRDGRYIAITTNDGTGRNRAAVYDIATREFRWAQPTPWEQKAGEISPDGRKMLLRTVVDGRSFLSVIDIAAMKETPLPIPPGQSRAAPQNAFSSDSGQVLVARSGADEPTELYAVDIRKMQLRKITNLAMGSLNRSVLPKSTIVTYRSFDGTLVSAIVTMPFNLERRGRAPAVVIAHGGPTSQAQDGFSAEATVLASRGYVVIQPNYRGSTGYGTAFQRANVHDIGNGDLKDLLAAKDFLVASGYVDPNRVGISGGSYGGYLALMALGKAPHAFAAAVETCGVIDWRTMATASDPSLKAFITSLLGELEQNGKLYADASPISYVDNIHVPLLILQGERDTRVPVAQAKQLQAALGAKNAIVETVIYADEGHGLTKREDQLDSLHRTVAWFEKHLGQRSEDHDRFGP
ncbi:Dipeptidyl aminopeptidase BIII (plasmid) [Asticcacaulis sp. MM231]